MGHRLDLNLMENMKTCDVGENMKTCDVGEGGKAMREKTPNKVPSTTPRQSPAWLAAT